MGVDALKVDPIKFLNVVEIHDDDLRFIDYSGSIVLYRLGIAFDTFAFGESDKYFTIFVKGEHDKSFADTRPLRPSDRVIRGADDD